MVQLEYPERVVLGPEEVIVVTGGSGFLGQHIIRVLQERAEGIKEIRVVDVVPYKKKLEFKENFPIRYFKADISIEDYLDLPFKGATCVIHSAAIVSVGHFVDRDEMRSVNMIGTTNIVFKCRQWNVQKLVMTSTVDAVFQKDSVFYNKSESQTELPLEEEKILMGYYGFTKAQAEAIVICTRTRTLSNGKNLLTTILRPTVLWGELDPYYVPSAMKVAKSCYGYLVKPQIFQDDVVLQATYAGNAAWAHVLAVHKLNQELNSPSPSPTLIADGETLFISDDTEVTSIYEFMKPFLVLKGYNSVFLPIPLFLILFGLLIMNWLVQNIFPVAWKKLLNQYPVFPTYEGFTMAHSTVHFSRKRATEILKYKPIYTEEEGRSNSAKYYRDVPI